MTIFQQMPVDATLEVPPFRHPWLDAYVAIHGQVAGRGNHGDWLLMSPAANKLEWQEIKIYSDTDKLVANVRMHFSPDRLPAMLETGIWKGRLTVMRGHFSWPAVDTTASRFHAASIGGIVVGAMWCFIFGLYLRRWLRERKAAA
ncbi:MAG: hypothetical protein ACYTKD_03770 [Planctomycetota bacterium]